MNTKKIIISLICLIIIIASASMVFLFNKNQKNQIGKNVFIKDIIEEKRINILFISLNKEEEREIKTYYLVSYEPINSKMSIIYIPLNFKLNNQKILSEYRGQDINYENLLRQIRETLEIPLKYFIVIPDKTFIKIIDLIGGIKLYNESEIKYSIPEESVFIHIKEGDVFLDGEKALEYAAFSEDVLHNHGKIYRQKKTLMAVLEKIRENSKTILQPFFFEFVYKNIFTNLVLKDVSIIFQEMQKIYNAEIVFGILPGKIYKDEKTNKHYMLAALNQFKNMLPVDTKKIIKDELEKEKPKRITVQILNGSGIPGQAKRIQKKLLPYPDIDVVEVGNASKFDYKKTLIYDRVDNLSNAYRVRKILNIGIIETKLNKNALVDVTVVIGKDFK